MIFNQTFSKVLLIGKLPEVTELLDSLKFHFNPKKYKIELNDLRIGLESLIEKATPHVKKIIKD